TRFLGPSGSSGSSRSTWSEPRSTGFSRDRCCRRYWACRRLPFTLQSGQAEMRSFLRGAGRHGVLLAFVLALAGACGGVQPQTQPTSGQAQARQDEPRRIEVLFLGHESMHHPSDSAVAILSQALSKEGINFSYTTDPDDLNPEN